MRSLFLLALCLLARPLVADILPVPYAELAKTLSNRVTFESLPQRPEPGINLDQPIRRPGIWIGERFAGQHLNKTAPHDAISGTPNAPLAIAPGLPGQNLSIARHRGLASNALLPLGPHGFSELSGRGEGAVALLFDTDQRAFGFRAHTDYPAPLGQAAPQGEIILHLFDRSGRLIARHVIHPRTGTSAHGFRTERNLPEIAGVLMTNTDPGGIALDDILFQIDHMLF